VPTLPTRYNVRFIAALDLLRAAMFAVGVYAKASASWLRLGSGACSRRRRRTIGAWCRRPFHGVESQASSSGLQAPQLLRMQVVAAPAVQNPAPQFEVGSDGFLYCEEVRVKDIQDALGPEASPFYLYSQSRIEANVRAYQEALAGMDAIIGYAVKANNNLMIMQLVRERGCGAVLVSGNELRLARLAGFDMRRTVFNGNGKTPQEIALAVRAECLINVDSEFDLENILAAAKREGRKARVLLRINPDIDPQVHPYVSTGLATSKFGIRTDQLRWFLDRIRQNEAQVELVGVHSHLGSTIKKVELFHDNVVTMLQVIDEISARGFHSVRFLNIGGGLGIDYERKGERIPTPQELIDAIRPCLAGRDLTLIIEPGRSLIGNAGILVCRVIGVKRNGDKRFIVVDGSMAELIRPALYGAYQLITLTEPGVAGEQMATYDIVGPVCESSDFLGKARVLPLPAPGTGLAVMDSGAYCMSMASNYNMKVLPGELMVQGNRWRIIRQRQRFADLLSGYRDLVALPDDDLEDSATF
jgi:diaminopimelate decarboxylase